MPSWVDELRHEFELAARAAAAGNAGRARVCARRAGGLAAREFLAQRGETVGGKSAYDLLKSLSEAESAPEEARRSARLLTLRVDEEFRLPPDVDLIREARQLCRALHPALEL
jgi:hypothetical protein